MRVNVIRFKAITPMVIQSSTGNDGRYRRILKEPVYVIYQTLTDTCINRNSITFQDNVNIIDKDSVHVSEGILTKEDVTLKMA